MDFAVRRSPNSLGLGVVPAAEDATGVVNMDAQTVHLAEFHYVLIGEYLSTRQRGKAMISNAKCMPREDSQPVQCSRDLYKPAKVC